MGIAKKDMDAMPEQPAEDLAYYANFRANLRLLRYTTDLSAEDLSKALGFKKHYRVHVLEYERGSVPKLEELIEIAKYFEVTIDVLLYKKARIVFE